MTTTMNGGLQFQQGCVAAGGDVLHVRRPRLC